MKIYDLTRPGVLLTLQDIGLDSRLADEYRPTDMGDVGYFRCPSGKHIGQIFFTRARMTGFLLWTPLSVIAFKERVSDGHQPQVIELVETEAGILYHVQDFPLVICQSNFSVTGGGQSCDHYVVIAQGSSIAPVIQSLPR